MKEKDPIISTLKGEMKRSEAYERDGIEEYYNENGERKLRANSGTKDQLITENYSIYNTDSMYLLSQLPDKSIDLSVYSPPFATKGGTALYSYSSSENDLSNCDSLDEFMTQYEFMVKEKARVTKPGRISAVHCTDVMDKSERLYDFPADIIKLHAKHGFEYRNRITIWKEPLKVRMRTMVKSLMHRQIVEDSTECFSAMPDYLLIFKKKGVNEVPVTHPCGLKHYAGEYPMLIDHLTSLGLDKEIKPFYDKDGKSDMTIAIQSYIWESFKELQRKYMGFDETMDHKLNKLSHIIWRRYASSVWDDIRIDNVLQFEESKDEDDEKHVHPLQLDVIDRVVELYTNPGEVVLTPFMGVGSEVYSPVSLGRKAIGGELKESYFKQSVKNLANVEKRFVNNQLSLI